MTRGSKTASSKNFTSTDVDKDNATRNQKNLAPALADGTVVGYGDDENPSGLAETSRTIRT